MRLATALQIIVKREGEFRSVLRELMRRRNSKTQACKKDATSVFDTCPPSSREHVRIRKQLCSVQNVPGSSKQAGSQGYNDLRRHPWRDAKSVKPRLS